MSDDELLAKDCELLAPILAAFARGTKRSKLRAFAGVCSSGHVLVETFPTASGLVAVWQERRMDWDETPTFARPLSSLDTGQIAPRCRCAQTRAVQWSDVLEAAESGRRRVVLDGELLRDTAGFKALRSSVLSTSRAMLDPER